MEGGAWEAAVHGVAKSRARLSDLLHFMGLATLCSVRKKKCCLKEAWARPDPLCFLDFVKGEKQI